MNEYVNELKRQNVSLSELAESTRSGMNEKKEDYQIYHKTYTSAVDAMLSYVKANGYDIVDDEVWNKISTGPGRPKNGDTVRHSLDLTKNGKVQKKQLNAQVYDMGNSRGNTYELNMYIS